MFLLLVVQASLGTGCTVMLWERTTFSTYYHAADPSNLQVYYSELRQDFLVQYDESRDKKRKVRTRYYWLEPNVKLTEAGRKPKFSEPTSLEGMQLLPQTPILLDPLPPGLKSLYVVCKPRDLHFKVYSGTNEINTYVLPDYDSNEQIALKILLTPPALAADATLVGAVVGLYCIAHSGGDE